jgi:hypothetical protein
MVTEWVTDMANFMVKCQTDAASNFFSSLGGVRLSPLGTLATNWPIVPAPGDT